MKISHMLKRNIAQRLLAVIVTIVPAIAWGVTLTDMEAISLDNQAMELQLTFDGPAPEVNGFSIERPPRISIDLPYTRSDLPKYNPIEVQHIDGVTILESSNRTRLVIKLTEPMKYSTQSSGHILSVYLSDTQQTADLAQQNAKPVGYQIAKEMGSSVVEDLINGIDFQRGEEGEANIIVSMDSGNIPVDIIEQAGRIRIMFQGEVLPAELRNRLDVMDFATIVNYIDATIENGNSVIYIEPEDQFEYLVYQMDEILTISVKEAEHGDVSRRSEVGTYNGDPISLNFQDIEVRKVLQIIAEFTDLNIVASDTVNGNVTMRLDNVPWDQALDIVLKTKGLDKRLDGSVMTIAPASEIALRERELLENQQQIRELAPVYTDLIQINYANAADIFTVLNGGEDSGDSLLTERGSVQVVERNNSLLVKDTQEKLEEVRALIEQLDIPIQQVMIEARIVSLSSTLVDELGVKWSAKYSSADNKVGRNVVTGGASLGSKSDFNIGFTSANGNILNLELSALISDYGGEVISQPKLITANKQTAMIKSGQEIPYQESTSSGATSTSFKDAVLGLEVTPQITPDGRVIMDIKINSDDKSQETTSGIPIIDTNEILTQVLVEDGQTVVLGGVYRQNQTVTKTKVPVLGDIPYLGELFRSEAKNNEKNELMVFITPRIVNERIAIN